MNTVVVILSQDIDARCEEVLSTGISFQVVRIGKSAGNEETITDLDAVTSYTIQLVVSNNGGFQTNTTLKYTTGELGTVSDNSVWQAREIIFAWG